MAARAKEVAPARKGGAASASVPSPAGKAKSQRMPTSLSAPEVDPITRKPLPHYLKPTLSSCHDICKYGKRQGAAESEVQEKTIRRLPSIKSASSPSPKPSSTFHRRSSSTSISPKDGFDKAISTPFTRTVSFGRTTTTSRTHERQPTLAIAVASAVATTTTITTTTTKKKLQSAKKNKNVSSSDSGSAVSNKVTMDSDSIRAQEDKIEEKAMIIEESHGSQDDKLEYSVPLQVLISIPSNEEPGTATVTVTTTAAAAAAPAPTATAIRNEPETAEPAVTMPTEEQIEEPEIYTIDNSPPQLSAQEELPCIEELQGEDKDEGAIKGKIDVDANAEAAKDVQDIGEVQKEEREEKEIIEEKEKKAEKEDKQYNDSSYDEYSDNPLDSEPNDDDEEEDQVEEKEGKPTSRNTPKAKGEEGQEDTPEKLRFRRGTVLSPKAEDDKNKSRKLKFRRGRIVDKKHEEASSSRRPRYKQKQEATNKDGAANGARAQSENVVLRAKEGQGKKDGAVVFNKVIEETASKLVSSRKSKVRALVGAFETVISIHETDAQSSQGHAHAHPTAPSNEGKVIHDQ